MSRVAAASDEGGPALKLIVLFVATALFGVVAVTPFVDRLLITGPGWLPLASAAGVALVVTLAVALYPNVDHSATVIVAMVVASGVYLLAGLVVISPALDLEGSILTLADRGGLAVGSLAIGLLAADLGRDSETGETSA